jgi:hypothetical protein
VFLSLCLVNKILDGNVTPFTSWKEFGAPFSIVFHTIVSDFEPKDYLQAFSFQQIV